MRMTLTQGGLGPIVDLGMSPSGAPANLATAPSVVDSQITDLVLVQRAGQLQKVASTAFAAGIGPALATSIMGSLSPTLTELASNIGTISAGLSSEVERATAAESWLAEAISSLSSNVSTNTASSLSALSQGAAAETTARASADIALSGSISLLGTSTASSLSLLSAGQVSLGGTVAALAGSLGALSAGMPIAFGTASGTLSLSQAGGGAIQASPALMSGVQVSYAGTQTVTLGAIAALAAGSLQGSLTAAAVALPFGSAPTASVSTTLGASAVLFGVPSGPPGATGAAVALPYSGIAASFNAATNVASTGATLTPGGSGAAINAWLYCGTSGTSSITGTPTAFAVGDYAVVNSTGTAWVHVDGQSNLGTVSQIVLPNSANPTYMLFDNGVADGNRYWVDGFGYIGAQLGPAGFAAYAATFNVAAIVSLTVGTVTTTNLSASGGIAIGLNYRLFDNGDGAGTHYFTDGFGYIGAKIDGSGLSAGNINSNTATFASAVIFAGPVSFATPPTGIAGGSGAAQPLAILDNWAPSHILQDTHTDGSAESGYTFASVLTAEAPFDGVQFDYTYDAASACTVTGAMVAVSATAADPLNPTDGMGNALLWSQVTFANAGALVPVWQQPNPPLAGAATSIVLAPRTIGNQETHTFSDTVFLPSISRTDGGTGFLVYTRSHLTGVPRPLVSPSPTDPLAGLIGGRTVGNYVAAGDYTSTTAGMPNNGLAGMLIPSGIRTLSRSRGISVCLSGASLIAGNLTTDECNNFGLQTQIALSTTAQPITVWNHAISGTGSLTYTARLHALLSLFQFHVVIITVWCENDLGGNYNSDSISQTNAYLAWQRAISVVERVRQYGAVPVLLVATPKADLTPVSEAWRLWSVKRCYEAQEGGIDIIDLNPFVSNLATNPATLLPQYSPDGKHLNDAGHSFGVPILAAILNKYRGVSASSTKSGFGSTSDFSSDFTSDFK